MADLRHALSAEQVFQRIALEYGASKTHRKTELSRRDMELLLDYHKSTDTFRKELRRIAAEHNCLRKMLEQVNITRTNSERKCR